MIATERVVQVESDNIAVRQAEVFAHCGCRSGAERLLSAHVRDSTADSVNVTRCDGGDGAAF